MILVDTNILIYAYHSGTPQHDAAEEWLESTLGEGEIVLIPTSVIHAFLRITTNPRVFPRAYTIAEALEIVAEWRSCPHVRVIDPGSRYWTIFPRLCRESGVRANLVVDAHLAALAIENGATVCTTDRDFRRFDGVKIVNPLR